MKRSASAAFSVKGSINAGLIGNIRPDATPVSLAEADAVKSCVTGKSRALLHAASRAAAAPGNPTALFDDIIVLPATEE